MQPVKSKPAYGMPCNNCGGCCIDRTCIIGTDLFGSVAPCPAVQFNENGSTCDVVARPKHYLRRACGKHGQKAVRDAVLTVLASGMGCDALIEGETRSSGALSAMMAKIDQDAYVKAYEMTTTR